MKAVIIYCSKHGTTEKVAALIASKLDEVTVIDLHKTPHPHIDEYDLVITGGSIHFGSVEKQVKRFCLRNMDILLQKNTALFICCMLKEKQKEQFDNAFPERLRKHSIANGIFGGELLFEKMNFLEKLLIKRMANINESTSAIDYAAIDVFVEQLDMKAATAAF